MSSSTIEAAIRACYSTWSENYYRDYYEPGAAYPPVHRELLRHLLSTSGAKNVLDAGCGPASFLRELTGDGLDLYGFDVTPEMVTEARRVLVERNVPGDHVWEGSVLAPDAFRGPAGGPASFDATVCIGVLPHIPAGAETSVFENLRQAVKPGGLVVVEARNALFSLFTFNRYSYAFIEELIQVDELRSKAAHEAGRLEEALRELQGQFRMDLPPVRKGKSGEPGYDEVLSRSHNPLVMPIQFANVGFRDVRLLYYHFHCLPPMLQGRVPELFRRESLAMENPDDWRGAFMSSAFMVAGTRV